LEHLDVEPRREEIFEYENVPSMTMMHHRRNTYQPKFIKTGEMYNINLWLRRIKWSDANRQEDSLDQNPSD
jgi:hypothetical protein